MHLCTRLHPLRMTSSSCTDMSVLTSEESHYVIGGQALLSWDFTIQMTWLKSWCVSTDIKQLSALHHIELGNRLENPCICFIQSRRTLEYNLEAIFQIYRIPWMIQSCLVFFVLLRKCSTLQMPSFCSSLRRSCVHSQWHCDIHHLEGWCFEDLTVYLCCIITQSQTLR